MILLFVSSVLLVLPLEIVVHFLVLIEHRCGHGAGVVVLAVLDQCLFVQGFDHAEGLVVMVFQVGFILFALFRNPLVLIDFFDNLVYGETPLALGEPESLSTVSVFFVSARELY